MKILYITHSNIWGGANVALYNVIKLMQQRGHQCFVLTDSKHGPFLDKLNLLHCQYYQHRLSLTIYPKSNKNFKGIKYIKNYVYLIINIFNQRLYIKHLIKKLTPEIVHTNVGPFDIAFNACNELKIPHIWHIREYQDIGMGVRFFPNTASFYKKTHSNGNYNIAITEGLFKYYHLRAGTDTVIYDGVFSESLLESQTFAEKEDYILFVGRIGDIKSPLDLIRVFPEFHKRYPKYKLFLAGSYDAKSPYKAACDHYIEENNLQKVVEFLGERNDVYQLMSKAQALVVTSKFEGFGFITVEAMLNNCVVIGRNTGGTKEQFDLGEAETGKPIGYRFTDEKDLLNCLIRVIEENTSHMRLRARRVTINHYTIEKHVNSLEKYYLRIIDDYTSNH